MQVLNELNRIRQVMGLIKEEDKNTSINTNFDNIVQYLKFMRLYNQTIERMLSDISEYAKNQVIDFSTLERGVRRLAKKSNKRKTVEDYFGKVLNSLKYRERSGYGTEPESEDYDFDFDEPSIIPKKIYRKELYELQIELLKLQEWLKITNKTVIIVFEGRDSAGKGSTIKKFTQNLDPRYYNVVALGVPTPEEKKNWWDRYKREIKKGVINLFDRSWYNRGLIEPVMGYSSLEEYEEFMDNVETFENNLINSGDYLFKLWFSIEKETQKRRFDIRQKSPLKYWKYSPNDSQMQDLWDRFTEFKEKLFDKTSTINNPWVIIDAEDKRVSGLNAIRYVLQNIPYEGKNESVVNKEYPEVVSVLTPHNPILKNNLKENNLHTSRVITEQSNTELLGRKVQINPDGSIHLENNKKNMVKLRFSIPSMNRLINIVKLIPYSGGYKIKTKMGVEKDIDNTIVKNILNFVDSNLSQTKIDTGTLTPSLGVTKIK